jgi:hypothetical protein
MRGGRASSLPDCTLVTAVVTGGCRRARSAPCRSPRPARLCEGADARCRGRNAGLRGLQGVPVRRRRWRCWRGRVTCNVQCRLAAVVCSSYVSASDEMHHVSCVARHASRVAPVEQQPDHVVSPPPHRMHEGCCAPLAALLVDVRSWTERGRGRGEGGGRLVKTNLKAATFPLGQTRRKRCCNPAHGPNLSL